MQLCANRAARFPGKQRGMSMFEMILGLGIMGATLAFVTTWTMQKGEKDMGRFDAEALSSFQQLATQYFISNHNEIMSAVVADEVTDAARRHCIVSVDNADIPVDPDAGNGMLAWSSTLKTCAFDATLLAAYRMWPSMATDYSDADTGGDWRYAAIVRRVMAPGEDGISGTIDDTPTGAADMLVVRMDIDGSLPAISSTAWVSDSVRRSRAQEASAVLGGTGGIVPIGEIGVCEASSDRIEACGNGWKVDLEGFLDGAQYSTVKSAISAP